MLSSPPNQHAKTAPKFVYIANNFNISLKCHIFVPHISTDICLYLLKICKPDLDHC